MSATLSTTIRPAMTQAPAAWLRILEAWWDGIARYLFRRAAITSLRELDDRLLRDIGITRSQIEAAARGLITAPNRAGI